MTHHKIIVIGASAGGTETLIQLCKKLPADLQAAILIVLHTPSNGNSMLPQILSRAGRLPARHATHEEPIRPGQIFIAPPNHHLLLNKQQLYLSLGPRENGHRPSIDSLFRSAALSEGPRVIGIILSGTLGDGSAGLTEIKRAGGLAIVQDPGEALFSGMPLNAIARSKVDYILPLEEISSKLGELARENLADIPAGEAAVSMEQNPHPGNIPDPHNPGEEKGEIREFLTNNPRTILTCPECGGVLQEKQDKDMFGYHCHAGHQFSEESLAVSHANSVETALWAAVRLLEERMALSARMAEKAREQGLTRSAAQFQSQQEDTERTAAILRNLILDSRVIVPGLYLDESSEAHPGQGLLHE
jgi:two-component system, chemotaxis family, protein-glutamate methylesterase/glutaminase